MKIGKCITTGEGVVLIIHCDKESLDQYSITFFMYMLALKKENYCNLIQAILDFDC